MMVRIPFDCTAAKPFDVSVSPEQIGYTYAGKKELLPSDNNAAIGQTSRRGNSQRGDLRATHLFICRKGSTCGFRRLPPSHDVFNDILKVPVVILVPRPPK